MTLFKRRIVWSDVLTFLLFLVLAALIWYGHAMHSVRNTRVPVYIQYTGKPGTVGLGEEGLPDKVIIEVRDAGARLNGYHSEPLHLTIDLRSYIHGDKGTIHVPSDGVRHSLSDTVQGTSQLSQTAPYNITCTYFTEQEKTVMLYLDGEITPASEYQMVGEPTLNRYKIKLYGQDKVLNTIDTVYTEHVELGNVTDTLTTRIALAIPKGTRAEADSVNLTVITERFTEKKFTLPIQAVGVPEGYQMHIFPGEVEVNVRVALAHFAQVQAQDIIATCTYTPERTETLEVELHYSNSYITSAWAYPAVVEFMLEK